MQDPFKRSQQPSWLQGGGEHVRMRIPDGHEIQVGTLLAVNYAGYHLPPWCYFRESWPDRGTGDRGHQFLGKLGEEETFLSRSHEFMGPAGSGSEYSVKPAPRLVSTWQKFVSDDNEELLPPTMDEASFRKAKGSFRSLAEGYAGGQLTERLDQLEDMSEYEFQRLLESCLSMFPSGRGEGLLREIRGYRWEQERVLMGEMSRRVEAALSQSGQFLSLQERRVQYKELDRLALHLAAQRMRFQVRQLEICDVRGYVLEEGLADVLDSMSSKLDSIPGLEKADRERATGLIAALGAGLKEEGGHGYPSFRGLEEDLQSRQESCDKFLGEVHRVLGLAGYRPDQEVAWQEYRQSILAMGEGERNAVIEDSLRILRGISIEEVQQLESAVNEIKGRVGALERGAKAAEQLILKFEERLVVKEDKQSENKQKQQQQQQQQQQTEKILSFHKQLPKSPLDVDDLNSYLRLPPIQNRLVLHEGYWPPLRNVGSEGTVSAWRDDGDGSGRKEFDDIQLSNLIGRLDEAFTVFSSTLADHGMPRPVPEPRPIKFRYGLGEVVPAWDNATKGISDMRLGEIRLMLCPSLTAYGDRGVPESVPPFMPLLYVIRMDGIYSQEDDNYESDEDIPVDGLGCHEAIVRL